MEVEKNGEVQIAKSEHPKENHGDQGRVDGIEIMQEEEDDLNEQQ